MEWTIYHNSRCSKSRQTLQLLRDNGVEPEIREYLKDVPTREELKLVLAKLDISPTELLRKNEDVYKSSYKGLNLSEDEWIDAMIEHPKMIERPIVIRDNGAVLGRPPENVLELLK